MVQKSRDELPLSSSRRIVRRIYEQNGYKIIDWLEGSCPKTVKKIAKNAPPEHVALDLALDALARANGKEPKRDPDRRPYRSKKRFPKKTPSITPINRLATRGKM